MAAYETTRRTSDGFLFGGRVTNFVANTRASFSNWNDARVTRNSLAKLSDRELEDIGLNRADIPNIAG